MYKKDVINFLFVAGFPVYGIGSYVAASRPSIGYAVAFLPYILIIVFYCVDLLYKREFEIRVGATYLLMLTFLASSVASLFIALNKGLPESSLTMTMARSLLIVVPFHSFLVVSLYNNDGNAISRLVLVGLSLLVAINLAGFFGLGLVNVTHSIEGRLSFPFIDGFYSGAALLAIINLMLVHHLRKLWRSPIPFTLLCAYFLLNLVFIHLINSRLTTLIFLVVLLLIFLNALRVKGVFTVSLLTLPILLSSGLILYEILQSPALAMIMQRVDIEDVTTFHGRSYIWQDVFDWVWGDRRGIVFGNGYKGHYFLDLIADVVKLWNAEEGYYLHLHSTSLEILVSQGLIIFVFYCILLYRTYSFYRARNRQGEEEGSLLAVVIFLLFMMQVDVFVYLDGLGALIVAWLVSRAAITRTPRNINDQYAVKFREQVPVLKAEAA
jgi:hypothetical protein